MASRTPRGLGVFGLLFALSALGMPARADSSQGCDEATRRSQVLRDQHKLIEARADLEVCAQALCPRTQSACEGWLEIVEKDIATIIVTAKDPTGKDLIDVNIQVDGQPFAMALDGLARPINPGVHDFVFELPGGTRVTRRVTLGDGERNKIIAVTVDEPAMTSPRGEDAEALPTSSGHGTQSSPSGAMRTAGWLLGATGLAGLGLGTVMAVLAYRDYTAERCDGDDCNPGALGRRTALVESESVAGDVALVGGASLLVTGAVLVLLAPNARHYRADQLHVSTIVGARGAGLLAGWDW